MHVYYIAATVVASKIVKPTVFHVVITGYWDKFSISNNHVSVGPHWLWYCHCAKLLTVGYSMLYILARSNENCGEHCGMLRLDVRVHPWLWWVGLDCFCDALLHKLVSRASPSYRKELYRRGWLARLAQDVVPVSQEILSLGNFGDAIS